jgi:hypothetical protein
MRVTDEMSLAIGKASQKVGSNAELGRRCGIHGATIGQYRNGMIQHMEDDTWEKLLPFIKEFLPNYHSPQPHPCDGHDRPRELKDLCARWDTLSPDMQNAVLGIARVALATSPQPIKHAMPPESLQSAG